jgi:Xaa-Pro dipeptidase
MNDRDIEVALVQDDSNVRYLTGMPSHSLLFMFRKGKALLLPWDMILAQKIAEADEMLPYEDFDLSIIKAVPKILKRESVHVDGILDLPPDLSFPMHESLRKLIPKYKTVCSSEGIDSLITKMRAKKDEVELTVLRKAAIITNEIISDLEVRLKKMAIKSELDAALFLEQEARLRGADGTGFETIAAGPTRSFGIHAFPSFPTHLLVENGMSIIDFGIKVDGYTSDVTMTIIRGNTTRLQETMIGLVQDAYDLALSMVTEGQNVLHIAEAVDDFFTSNGVHMPHALGHGIGLEPHESPLIGRRNKSGAILEKDMIFTIEPGLYHSEAGGVRLENDILMTENGPEVLTNSRILRFP